MTMDCNDVAAIALIRLGNRVIFSEILRYNMYFCHMRLPQRPSSSTYSMSPTHMTTFSIPPRVMKQKFLASSIRDGRVPRPIIRGDLMRKQFRAYDVHCSIFCKLSIVWWSWKLLDPYTLSLQIIPIINRDKKLWKSLWNKLDLCCILKFLIWWQHGWNEFIDLLKTWALGFEFCVGFYFEGAGTQYWIGKMNTFGPLK